MWFFFFFSSRRRHTRYIGDWSSDVCSSDLESAFSQAGPPRSSRAPEATPSETVTIATRIGDLMRSAKIGRASCRERGDGKDGGAVSDSYGGMAPDVRDGNSICIA